MDWHPCGKNLSSEIEKYIHLEDTLSKRVIGQDEAIKAVSDAIRRNKTGIGDERRPLVLFCSQVLRGGKTELAKVIASFLFDDEKALTRIDMSVYMEKFSVSGSLELLRVCWDKIRAVNLPKLYVAGLIRGFCSISGKAHPEVFNILLQLLDDGRLTWQGRIVDFTIPS